MWNHEIIRLKQSGPNAFAIGSEIRIRIGTRDVSREVLVGGVMRVAVMIGIILGLL